MSFIKGPVLALGIASSVMVLAACASESSGSGSSGTSEQSGTSERWRPPPDYNRGPQIRNNP